MALSREARTLSLIGIAGTALGAYHGYKRNGSVAWAVVWGLAGGAVPIVTIPVAVAQGFGEPGPDAMRAQLAR